MERTLKRRKVYHMRKTVSLLIIQVPEVLGMGCPKEKQAMGVASLSEVAEQSLGLPVFRRRKNPFGVIWGSFKKNKEIGLKSAPNWQKALSPWRCKLGNFYEAAWKQVLSRRNVCVKRRRAVTGPLSKGQGGPTNRHVGVVLKSNPLANHLHEGQKIKDTGILFWNS